MPPPIGATTRNDIAVLKLDGSVDPKEKRIYPIWGAIL